MNTVLLASNQQAPPLPERPGRPQQLAARHLCAAALAVSLLVVFWPAFQVIANLGLHADADAQIVAAPFLLIFFTYWERGRIFRDARWNPRLGIPALSVVLAGYFVFVRSQSYSNGGLRLNAAVGALILAWMSAFILCYGLRSFSAARFPFCCLALMIPVPGSLADRLTFGLEHGSAAVSFQLLHLAGVPVLAQGTKLLLPGLEIEVAPECSGIHSCLALALVGLLASRVCLRNSWNRLLLVTSTIPIAIFKNAIRISVISSLGAYVNHAFLFGRIHRYGGLVFTPIAVVLLVFLLLLLQKSETWMAKRPKPPIIDKCTTA